MYINEDGTKYFMFIQKGLEKYLPKKEITTIRYYIMGYNDKLYLALTTLTNL